MAETKSIAKISYFIVILGFLVGDNIEVCTFRTTQMSDVLVMLGGSHNTPTIKWLVAN